MTMNRLSSILSSIVLHLLILESSVSLPMSQKPSLGYPVSRQECARQSQNVLKCSDKEYHDIYCSCRPCNKTKQPCSQPHPDEFCIRLARLSYCVDGTTTLPSTSTATSTSASTSANDRMTSVTTLLARIVALSATNSPSATEYKLARSNSSARANFQTDTNPTLASILVPVAAVLLIGCGAIFLLLMLMGRMCPKMLPNWTPNWRIICPPAPQRRDPSNQIPLLTLSPPPPVGNGVTLTKHPPVSKGVTLTSPPSSPEELNPEATPPGIPPSVSADQQSIPPEVEVQQQCNERTRDQENARKKAAADSTGNATSL